jgi:hypothetical protein
MVTRAGEAFDFEFPDGLGRAKFFEEINVANFLHAFGQHLGRASNSVEIDTLMFLAGSEGFITHAAFADEPRRPNSRMICHS